jgi:hypothetical protein
MGSEDVLDILNGSLPVEADDTTKFVEGYKLVQGLLRVVTVLTTWHARAAGKSRAEVIRMLAQGPVGASPYEVLRLAWLRAAHCAFCGVRRSTSLSYSIRVPHESRRHIAARPGCPRSACVFYPI